MVKTSVPVAPVKSVLVTSQESHPFVDIAVDQLELP